MPKITTVDETDGLTVFHVVRKNKNLRIIGEGVTCVELVFEGAEMAAEGHQLARRQILIANRDDLIVVKRIQNGLHIGNVQRFRQIDARDLRPHGVADFSYMHGGIISQCCRDRKVENTGLSSCSRQSAPAGHCT